MAGPAAPPITPVTLPRGVREVLLFGGTFDPPHAAHAALPFAVREKVLGPGAWLIYVPAARNPLKDHLPGAPEAQRLKMVRLLVAEQAIASKRGDVAVWTDEIDRARVEPGPTYTNDTVERLRSLYPSLDIRLLIGSDQAANFHRWRAWRELFEKTRPVVMLRPPNKTKDDLWRALSAAGAWSPAEIDTWLTRVAPLDVMDTSSTDIRKFLLARRRDKKALEQVLTPKLLAYIEDHHLYESPTSPRP